MDGTLAIDYRPIGDLIPYAAMPGRIRKRRWR